MRSTKFLAAMAGIAMFTACTQENMFNTNDASLQEELVGARLVGTNLSITTDYADGTRYAGGNTTWEDGDRVGLGWLVVGDFASPQPETLNGQNLSNELYANHQFDYAGSNVWESKGNFYEGWYFAYYPWTYEKEAAKTKKYVMNPAMKGRGAALQYSQSLYISNRQHVSADKDVDQENGSLRTPFQMNQAVKFIKVTTRPEAGSAFAATSEGDLKNLEIKSISINLGEGHNYFAKDVEILAANLPETVESIEGKTKYEVDSTNLSNFRKSLLDETNPVLRVLSSDSVLTRDVTKAKLLVSTNTPGSEEDVVSVYFNVLPVEGDFSLEDMTITVQAEGGASFVIKYDAKSANAAAFDAFKTAVNEGGALNTFNEPITEQKNTLTPLVLDLVLCDEDFVTDFSDISNIEEWTAAVNMVNTLQRTDEVFTIDSVIDFENSILMPTTCKITVNRAGGHSARNKQYIKLIGTHDGNDFPANLTCNTNIEIAKDATVENAHLLKALQTIHNYGTLNVPAGESVAEKTILTTKKGYSLVNHETGVINLEKLAQVNNLTNEGRVNVVYGSFVEMNDANKGIIAYTVMPADANKPARIQNVINTVSGNKNGYAQVNVLVFNNENLNEFDFTYVELGNEGEEDYYDGLVGDSQDTEFEWTGLDEVSLEINGVAVKSTSEKAVVTVKNVTMTGENASLTNVNIAGDLKVTDGGEVYVGTINGNVESDGNVTAESINATSIEVTGDVTAANTINANSIEVTGDVTANYINGNESVTITEGNVTARAITSNSINFNNSEVEASISITGDVVVNSTAIETQLIDGNLTINDGENSIDVNRIKGDVTVVSGQATLALGSIDGDLTNNGEVTMEGDDNVSIMNIVNNATLTANTTIYVENITLLKNVSVTTVNEDTEKVIWYTGKYQQGGTTSGKIEKKAVVVVESDAQASTNDELIAAFADLTVSSVVLAPGEYTIPNTAKGRTLTIIGTGNPEDVVVKTVPNTTGEKVDYSFDGSTVTFEGITISTNSATYNGYARLNATYKNCIINGQYTLYGNSTFENCTFNVSGNVYNIWTWGAAEAKFVDCTFNSDGKALLLYGQVNTKLTVENCTFNDFGGLTDLKAAIEIGNDYNKSYTLIVDNTTVNGYEINNAGINTGTTLWANKNSMTKANLNVVVDGVDVY